jgi:cytoskeletal protein CcmA (bactofilin family)
MFSKSKINEPGPKADTPASGTASAFTSPVPPKPAELGAGPAAMKPKAAPSILSSDLMIKGNLKSSGDIQIEGQVEGDIHAHLLTVGEGAIVRGEIVADDIVVNGRVVGRVRGLKVRLTSTAKVEGDIIHKTIAIESGAHFEGSVQRQDDPLGNSSKPIPKMPAPAASVQAPASAPAAAPSQTPKS